MRGTLTAIAALIVGSVAWGNDLEWVKPGSVSWNDIFDPPFIRPTELAADSQLRKQLFDVLRPDVVKRANQSVRFRGSLKVFKNWAFFHGTLLDTKGREIRFNYDPTLDYSAAALWLRANKGWMLVDFGAGSSGDVWYLEWFAKYNVPKEFLHKH